MRSAPKNYGVQELHEIVLLENSCRVLTSFSLAQYHGVHPSILEEDSARASAKLVDSKVGGTIQMRRSYSQPFDKKYPSLSLSRWWEAEETEATQTAHEVLKAESAVAHTTSMRRRFSRISPIKMELSRISPIHLPLPKAG